MNTARVPGLPFIFVTLVLDMVGLGVVIPVVPELIAHFTGNRTSAAQNLGVLVALYAFTQLLAAPTLGALSDRFGRRPVLLVGTITTALAYGLAALAPSLGWLFLARALGGVGGSTLGVAYAYIADVSTPENRARNFGFASAAFGLGLIVGPAVGGLLGQRGLSLPFIVSAALAALNFLYGLLVLPESRRPTPGAFDVRALIPLRALGTLARFPGLPALALVTVLSNLAMQFLTSTWVLHGAARYGWTTAANGLALALAGLLGVPVQTVLLPRVLKRLGNEGTFALGMAFGIVGNVLYGVASHSWMICAAMPIAALGGLAMPPLQALIVGKAARDAQGAVQGALSGLGSLCAIVGPLAATTIFAHFAESGAAPHVPGIAFFAAALLLAAGLAVFRMNRPQPARPGTPA